MKKFFTYSAALIVMSIFIVGFVAVFSTGTSDNSELPRDNVVTVEKEGVLEGYTYQDLLDKTPVVIMAHVKSVADPIQIMPVSGTTLSNFTDFTLTVDEVFRGDISVGDEVVVRIEGGQTNGLNVVVEESPELSMNSQMLMFLYQPNMGGAYNTTGDYYYIQGVSQGAFVQAENNENSYVNYAGNITLTLFCIPFGFGTLVFGYRKTPLAENKKYVPCILKYVRCISKYVRPFFRGQKPRVYGTFGTEDFA